MAAWLAVLRVVFLEHHFLTTFVRPAGGQRGRAHLEEHSGPGAGTALGIAPSALEFSIEPTAFRTLLLERLDLPLQVVDKRCSCGELLDARGRHRAACSASGRLRARAVAPERCLQRICREAGAVVQPNAFLKDMNVGVCSSDERRIEVLASGLPLFEERNWRLMSRCEDS